MATLDRDVAPLGKHDADEADEAVSDDEGIDAFIVSSIVDQLRG